MLQLQKKKSLKLDRPKGQVNPKEKQRQKKGRDYEEESELDDRLKKNHIHLDDRSPEDWDNNNKKSKKKGKVITDRYEPANLPSGSMFLPV